MQGQVVAILNMILVIAGAFVFGYKAVEYSLDSKDITKVNFSSCDRKLEMNLNNEI